MTDTVVCIKADIMCIDAQVIDLISLKPFDMETIAKSVRKTRKVIIVEECMKTGGCAARVAQVLGRLDGQCTGQACLLTFSNKSELGVE